MLNLMESPGKPPLEVLKWITQKGFVPGLKVAGSFVDTHNLRKDHLQATKGGTICMLLPSPQMGPWKGSSFTVQQDSIVQKASSLLLGVVMP